MKLWEEKATITAHSNGKREIVTEDKGCKWTQIDHPNGDRIQHRGNLQGQYIQQTERPNGMIMTITADGRRETQYPNGVVILESPDGSVEMRMDGKTFELAPVIPALKDVQRKRRERWQGKEQVEEQP